jgi:hypothetical protein
MDFHQPVTMLFSQRLLMLYDLFICSVIPSVLAHSVQGQKWIVNHFLLAGPAGIALGKQREFCEDMSDREPHQQLPLTNL